MTIILNGFLDALLVTRGLTPAISVPVTSFPDPFTATASPANNPFTATASPAVNPFAATGRYKGS